MRVNVGDTWHEAEIGRPIMIELTETDKEIIANMDQSSTKYANVPQ